MLLKPACPLEEKKANPITSHREESKRVQGELFFGQLAGMQCGALALLLPSPAPQIVRVDLGL